MFIDKFVTLHKPNDESKLQFFVSIKFRESFSREVDFTLRGGAPEDLMYLHYGSKS